MEEFRKAFIQIGWKDLERLVLLAGPDEEFLHQKINIRDIYVDYGSREDIPRGKDAFS